MVGIFVLILSILACANGLQKVSVRFNQGSLNGEGESVTGTHLPYVALREPLVFTFDGDVLEDGQHVFNDEGTEYGRNKREAKPKSLSYACRDDVRVRVNNMTCGQYFVVTGNAAFCSHPSFAKYCCSTQHRHCSQCTDTPGVGVAIYGMSKHVKCDQFMSTTGIVFCNDVNIRKHCCSTRRKYCETCVGDTNKVLVNNQTCQELFSQNEEFVTKICSLPAVIQHCCASRAHFCPCQGDVHGTLVHWNGNIANCNNVFHAGAKTCNYPNLWQQCCETREAYCNTPPPLIAPIKSG